MRKKKHTNDLLFLLIILLQSILIAVIIFIQIPKIEAKFEEQVKVIEETTTRYIKFLKKTYILKSFKVESIKVTTKKIEPLKSKNIKNVLNYNDPVYFGHKTPWYILSAIHNNECSRKKTCRDGAAGELGTMQVMPLYWNSDKYCKGLIPNKDDVKCADKILYTNYLTHNQNWHWTAKFYNCGARDLKKCDEYADRAMKEANRIKNL